MSVFREQWRISVLTMAFATVALTVNAAQPEWWRRVDAPDHPSARGNSPMTLAAATGEVVLFGGLDAGGGLLSDTWIFSGLQWSLRTPNSSPSARSCHALAYDAGRQVVVLFGGWSNGYLADTWEWDGASWTQKSTSTSPAARCESRMVFDPLSNRIVLFGGFNGTGLDASDYLGDTWTFDGGDWRLEQPTRSPSARQSFALAQEQTGVVLYGGFNYAADPNPNTGAVYGDTWRWDGIARDWMQLAPSSSPPPLFGAGAALDTRTGEVILFGGSSVNSAGAELGATWRWDGSTWTDKRPHASPGARHGPAAASGSSGGVVLFGGYSTPAGGWLSDTWVYPCPPGRTPQVNCSR